MQNVVCEIHFAGVYSNICCHVGWLNICLVFCQLVEKSEVQEHTRDSRYFKGEMLNWMLRTEKSTRRRELQADIMLQQEKPRKLRLTQDWMDKMFSAGSKRLLSLSRFTVITKWQFILA